MNSYCALPWGACCSRVTTAKKRAQWTRVGKRGGGGSASLKNDAQGKTHAMGLLRIAVEVPDDYDPPRVGTPGALAPRGSGAGGGGWCVGGVAAVPVGGGGAVGGGRGWVGVVRVRVRARVRPSKPSFCRAITACVL